jgi:hypothetical protein
MLPQKMLHASLTKKFENTCREIKDKTEKKQSRLLVMQIRT